MISENINKTILVTGCCGFIGYHLVKRLNCKVIGVDNINNYYDQNLKLNRLKELKTKDNFTFIKTDISEYYDLYDIFKNNKIDTVVNLAAQAGVRYSLENPEVYLESNIIGFHNILKFSKDFHVKHFIYASSSSVYGNSEIPFSEDQNTDKPLSLYAATKKSNELIAYTYSNLYSLPTTGLRLFTVYGPYGRPDMIYYKFAKKMIDDEFIIVYNNGENMRDFTYIDDVIDGILAIINNKPIQTYNIYNIGNSQPIKVIDFVNILYNKLKKYGIVSNFYKLKKIGIQQPGDVAITYSNTSHLENDFNIKPKTRIDEGLDKFAKWLKEYKEEN